MSSSMSFALSGLRREQLGSREYQTLERCAYIGRLPSTLLCRFRNLFCSGSIYFAGTQVEFFEHLRHLNAVALFLKLTLQCVYGLIFAVYKEYLLRGLGYFGYPLQQFALIRVA